MKKILSLLTAITLTTSGVSGVISCSAELDQKAENQKQANNFARSLNNKSISFMQQGVNTKASDYTAEILTALKTKTSGNYNFTFATTAEGNKNITTTDQDFGIKIQVNNITSTTIATIKIKFTDNSDISKANNFATSLNNKSISFMQQGVNTKASDYTAEILTALKTKTSGNYNFTFATTAEGNKNITTTDQDFGIKIQVNNITSTTIATIKIKFTNNSDIEKANEIATKLNNQSISFNQVGSKTKANEYNTEIQTALNGKESQTPTPYSFEFSPASEGEKTLTTSDQTIGIKIIVNGAKSNTINIQVKFTNNSDIEKANEIATKLNNQSISFNQVGSKTKANEYNTEIQTALNGKESQTPTPYSFEFSTASEGEKILTTTDQPIKIKIKVNTATSTTIATVNIKFIDNSDIAKANRIAEVLKDKSYSFKQVDLKTKANEYNTEIQTEFNKIESQTPTPYSFEFSPASEGEKTLTTTDQNFTIHIIVGTAKTNAINIKIKFTDYSNKTKANDIATQLKDDSIIVVEDSSKKDQKANTYKTEIQTALNKKVAQTPTAYSFEFSPASEGDTVLTLSDQTFGIKVKVGGNSGVESNEINIKIKLTIPDSEKANNIANTLKTANINPIKLNINNDKQKLSDYFQSDIKALLDAKLTTKEKTYNYSLVNTQNITNLSQDFNVKIQVGNAISTTEFTIKVQFKYIKMSGDLSNKTINVVKKIDNKIYVGTFLHGVYMSSDNGKSFKHLSAIDTSEISSIQQIGTGSNAKIYVGTIQGLYTSTDLTGTSFSKLQGVLENEPIGKIKQINNKIYVSSNSSNDLYASTDLTGATFIKVTGIPNSISINTIQQIGTGSNTKIYVGTSQGLYESSNGNSFTILQGVFDSKSINTIQQIGTGSNTKIYVGTNSSGLYVSSDGAGTNFTPITSIPNNKSIQTIKEINNKIYIGTSNDIYISDLTGASFSKINEFSTTDTIYTIEQIDNKIYIGTGNGIYYNFVS